MISVDALELLLKVDSAVERHNGGMQGENDYLEAKDNLQDYISALESELASVKARLAEHEVGFDPRIKTPKHDQWILVKHVNDGMYNTPMEAQYDEGDDGENGVKYYPYSEEGWVNWTEIKRWFPLPGSKGGEA